MPFNSELSDRIREALSGELDVEEKFMFGGVCYMVNSKMCMGVVGEELMCRVDPMVSADYLERHGTRPMDFTGKSMKGFVFVNEEGYHRKADFMFWVNASLTYNPLAKSSKKKVRKS